MMYLPDGMELQRCRVTGRGDDLHVVVGTAWYRTDLEALGSRDGEEPRS